MGLTPGALWVGLLQRLPSAALSRAFGHLADIEFPSWAQPTINRLYARAVNVDTTEAARPPESYRSLNAFFTRRLREGVHRIDRSPDALISPVDGRLSEFGRVRSGTLIQAKGRLYSVAELLADDPDVDRFEESSFATLYLSPRDYHHIHCPVDGEVVAMSYVPGQLLPVNRFGVAHVEKLFARNERLTSFVETSSGRRVAVVKVGATCVGRISVEYDAFYTNRQAQRDGFRREIGGQLSVGRGEPLGTFHLGSTVVLLIEGRDFEFDPELRAGQPIRLGRLLGRW